MFKIQTLNKISAQGLAQLPLDDYETASEILNPDAKKCTFSRLIFDSTITKSINPSEISASLLNLNPPTDLEFNTPKNATFFS